MSNTALARPFLWTTQDGEVFEVSEMKTSHLFYALRMIFNHTVSAQYRLKEGHAYRGPRSWPISYRRQAVAAFITELVRRKPLADWTLAQLEQMQKAVSELQLYEHRNN